MFTLIKVFFFLFFIGLTGWTITTYLIKEGSQKFIKEELKNLFNSSKMLFTSIKTLIGVLTTHSFSSESVEEAPTESKKVDDQLLKLVQPIEPCETVESPSFEVPIQEDEDTALSSFSPELIEVINDEEEKIA